MSVAYKDSSDPRNLEAKRAYYRRNKERMFETKKEREKEMKKFITNFKDVPCKDCGMKYPPYVMDLDHLPEFQKSYPPASLHKTGSWRRVHEELAKCEVVCANCHRLRTHMRLV